MRSSLTQILEASRKAKVRGESAKKAEKKMYVPKARVELARSLKLRQILSLVRLPIPPLRQGYSAVREEGLEPTRLMGTGF